MNFRFLKKKDGSTVLQQENFQGVAWIDVPVIEEKPSARDRLLKAISIPSFTEGFLEFSE